ncbi:unnamed protein product [Pelagomonas calceolata]|uniref:SGNH hydrolase-type esterase domain-containing protein n=1 Tax=Pelagomonas calceolata TaxID=35677 RepID=A0A8J2WRV9_9STRA|nr:unnamed protein product [Pelagomonas calceolata]
MAGQPAMRAPRRRAASTARLGALLAALPAAAARPYLGAWVRNDSLAPTFDRRLLSYAPHFHEAQMGRNRKCDTGHDVSWRWAWKPVGKKRPMKLKSGDGLCDALRGVRVINIGDSLTHQLVETWRARRIASSWPVPDGYAYKKSEEGHLSKEIDLANEFARQTRGGRRRRRLGPHKEAREAAEREARQRSDADEQCANGATFQFIEPQRPWSLVPWAFQEHDPSVAKCGVAFRNQTRDFATHFCRVQPFPSVAVAGPAEPTVELTPRRRRDARTFRSVLCRGGRAAETTVEPTREPTAEPRTPSTPSPRRSNNRRHKASELSVWRAVFGKGAIEKDKKKREKRKQRHKAERTRMAVVYNCFAHLESIARFPRPVGSCVFVLLARCRARLAWTYPHDFAITRDILPPNTPSTQALEVMNCYAEEAPDRFPTSACRRGVVSRGLSTR